MNEFQSQNQRSSQRPSWSQPESGWGSLQAQTAAEASLTERLSFIRKVYGLFFAATLFAIGGVLLGFSNVPLMAFAVEHPIIMLIAMIGGVMGATAVRHKPGINLAALFGFTTLTGVIISPLLYIISFKNPASILEAGILTGLLNILIIGSSALYFAGAVATLLLFSGFVLYDTSNIIRRYPTNEYVAGALALYLDAFNIFLALLRILNSRD